MFEMFKVSIYEHSVLLIQVAKEGGEKWKAMTDEVSTDEMFWIELGS